MDRKSDEGLTRIPGENDLVRLAREPNRLGVAYVVIGGFAINRLGLVRATDDLDLLIARDSANQALRQGSADRSFLQQLIKNRVKGN